MPSNASDYFLDIFSMENIKLNVQMILLFLMHMVKVKMAALFLFFFFFGYMQACRAFPVISVRHM